MIDFIGIRNTFTNPNAPIVIESGYYNTKQDGYKCLTKLSISEKSLNPITAANMYKVNETTIQCATVGSYSVLVANKLLNTSPQLFSFTVYEAPQIINKEWLTQLINSELPTIYKSQNQLNNADNYGSATVLSIVYESVYQLFYNTITSIGKDKAYNSNWEYVYVGANNFLQNAVYPADFLNTLMQVITQTGISMPNLAILASKIAFQYTGLNNPVSMWYNPEDDVYYIDVYVNGVLIGWELGVSELGIDTVLSMASASQYSYILSEIVAKLIPITVNYQIQLLNYQDFLDGFNTAQVANSDYIDSAVKYDAYMVVNNNNIFNTKGFYKNA